MALIVEDRVAETSTSTGTGTFALAGAIAGYRTFASVCATNDIVYYVIEAIDSSGVPTGAWETGLGTYSAANTLTRTTVSRSSNSNAAVSFAAGTKRVVMTRIADVGRRSEVLIARIVTSGSQGTVTFTGIPSIYVDLVLRGLGRSNDGADNDQIYANFNNDTTSGHYDWTRQGSAAGGGFSSGGGSVASAVIGYFAAGGSLTNMPGAFETTIPQYSATQFFKIGESLSLGFGSSVVYQMTLGFDWRSTAAITQIDLTLGSGSTFVDGTVVELWGR